MTTTSSRTTTGLRALRITATLVVLVLAWQFVTAGQILPRGGPIEAHAAGAVLLHLVSGLAVVAALVHARTSRAPWWPTALALAVFVLSFVQAYVGDEGIMALHVPGAILLTAGAVWLTAWAWMRAR